MVEECWIVKLLLMIKEIELLLPMLLLQIIRLVGDGAKNQSSMNPQNTVFDAKRLIGRKFTIRY